MNPIVIYSLDITLIRYVFHKAFLLTFIYWYRVFLQLKHK